MGFLGLLVALAVIQTTTAQTTGMATGTTTMLPTTAKPPVCPFRECSCTGDFVDCSGKDLRYVPYLDRDYVPGEFTKIDLSGNDIDTIMDNQLPENITELDLGDNPIRSISEEAFIKSSNTLKKVRFNNPSFTQLPTALKSLEELEYLEVSGVNITDWNLEVIQHLAFSVKSVKFSDTSMTQWPEFIKYFVFLHELDLSYNSIKRIPDDSLVEWKDQLTHLRLAHTNLTSVSFAIQLTSLQYLDISGNILRNHVQLSYDLIPLSRTLKALDLSSNFLTTTPRLIAFSELELLDLSNNALRTSDIAAFSLQLVSLNLDDNQFTELPEGVKDFKHLETLSIRNNKINVLSGEQFMQSSSPLVNLDVSGNPIHSVTRHAFDSLRKLQKLDMSSTGIDALPLALSQLGALKELNMEDNSGLLCKCEEKSLSYWYAKRMNNGITVVGECGHESVTNFIDRFLTHCL